MPDNKKDLNKGISVKLTLDTSDVKQKLDEIEKQVDRIVSKYSIIQSRGKGV